MNVNSFPESIRTPEDFYQVLTVLRNDGVLCHYHPDDEASEYLPSHFSPDYIAAVNRLNSEAWDVFGEETCLMVYGFIAKTLQVGDYVIVEGREPWSGQIIAYSDDGIAKVEDDNGQVFDVEDNHMRYDDAFLNDESDDLVLDDCRD